MQMIKKLLAVALAVMLCRALPSLALSSGNISANAAILIEAESKEAVFDFSSGNFIGCRAAVGSDSFFHWTFSLLYLQ